MTLPTCPNCGREYDPTGVPSACPSCGKPLGDDPPPAEETGPRPLSVSAVVVIYSGVAVCQLGFGLGLVAGMWPPDEAAQLMGRAVFVLIGVIQAAMGSAALITGQYLWRGYDWARSAFMVFVALGGMLQVAKALRAEPLPMLQLAASVAFLVALNGAGAKRYCTRTELRGAMPVVAVAAIGVVAFGGFAVAYFLRMA